MKKYTHAWLALKALELLRSWDGRFHDERNKRLGEFTEFMSNYPSTFIRGAWFPDKPIADNLQDGHTWKYYLDPVNGREERYRPSSHNNCLQFVQSELDKKVSLEYRYSDLPDRCEALSQAIRDAIIITNHVRSGDVIAFNYSQIAILFLMLSHYVCDAHVPLHCDKRHLNKPSKVHGDLEEHWNAEITKYYRISTKRKNFILGENQDLLLDTSQVGFQNTILHKCNEILRQSKWENMGVVNKDWRDFLGSKNNNIWDYLVSVCLVSFHMSFKLFPSIPPTGVDYNTVRIKEVPALKDNVIKYSPYILADAINSVALVWLATWERWELLEKGIR